MGIGALKAKELSVAGFGTGAATAIGTIVLAAMMVAIQFLPAKELADLSERSEITYEKTADGSLMPSQLLTAIVPNLYGKSFPRNPIRHIICKMQKANRQKPITIGILLFTSAASLSFWVYSVF